MFLNRSCVAIRGGKSVSSAGHHIGMNIFYPRHRSALRAGVTGLRSPCIWCPVEDTDLPLRIGCLRFIALFREGGGVSLQKFFPMWILTPHFFIDSKKFRIIGVKSKDTSKNLMYLCGSF